MNLLKQVSEADVLVNNPTAINGAAVRAEGGVVRSIL